jgi:hypothetical protein
MKKITIPALCLLSAALAISLFFGRMAAANLLEENRALRAELDQAKQSHANTTQTPGRSAENAPDPELIRLRGEVTTLRQEKKELENARSEIQTLRAAQQQTQAQLAEARSATATAAEKKAPRNLPRESWAFAGYNDPESALQSVLWAGLSGNVQALMASLTPEQLARMQNEDNRNLTPAQVLERMTQQISKVKAFQVLQANSISPDETVLTLYLDGLEGSEKTPRMKMQRVGNTWRLAGPYRPEDAAKGK